MKPPKFHFKKEEAETASFFDVEMVLYIGRKRNFMNINFRGKYGR